MSHETRQSIEEEVKRMLDEANVRATKLLKKHEKDLHMLAGSRPCGPSVSIHRCPFIGVHSSVR